ncbi:MAG: hypothetical protein A3B13_01415 [Candidatus Liptonbacteria bacterium RIFCSPLOWO2_01_FULL_45_15]|uniref:DUF3800 domain-containing protein n=1 Tax=Candidatus Liptonbacteria bacterium RIFCSPLOWO2_01_FULL_45_15 TaxID=1798649 RepID=A0A1G2CE69_9BACT|nr:MAG: hypothetical protein A3B13_01415 [Candidatus Liptonbacteria bacterium RIFCSPLOWO2_01_FULL_45_15]
MRILYIDESGDTASFEQGGTKILVLTGCIIDEKDKRDIELKFREIKKRYYQNPDIEIKSNFLRYANPKINDPEKTSPIKLYDQEQYDSLQLEIQNFLKDIPTKIISVIIDKKGYWAKYPSQNPYHAAYTFLVERFQTYLENNDASGICIIDPREGRVVDKKFIDKDLDKVHGRLQWSDDGYWKQCSRVIEKALFSDSELTIGIQVADLYCYPVFNVFEYNKKSGEYEWFDKISKPKLYFHSKNTGGEAIIDSTGLKFFPTETKKDFRLYE